MIKTIEYIGMMGTAITIWRAVQKNGTERLKEEGGEERLANLIDYATEKLLWKIDPKVILNEICSDSQGIEMRLGILNDEYKLQFQLDVIDQMLYEPIHLPCGMALDAMEDLKRAFEDTWQEITDVIEIANTHTPQAHSKKSNPKTKKTTSKWWKDGKLEEAQAKFKGQKGSATVRAILRMVYDTDFPLPTFRDFKEKFPDVIGKTDFHRIRNEFEPSPQIEKNAIK